MTPASRPRGEPLEMTGDDGRRRRGMLWRPADPPAAVLVLLPAGVQPRSGPGGLHVWLARRLAQDRIATCCVDGLGIGESDGTIEAAPTHVVWRSVETGRFLPDAHLAVAAVRVRVGAHVPLYLAGLCGGGLTALAAAAARPSETAGVVALNVASCFSSAPGRRTAPVPSEARRSLASLPRKLLSPATWKRALAGGGWRATSEILHAALGRHRADEALNPLFLDSFRRLRQIGLPQLQVFAGGDVRWLHFRDLVLPRELGGRDATPDCRVRVLPDADHHFVHTPWREQVARWITEWTTSAPRVPAAPRSL